MNVTKNGMFLLLVFVFFSGMVTILSPCIWPLLPILLSTSVTGGKSKPLGIIIGLMLSFMLFTLFLSYILQVVAFNPESLRSFSVIIVGCLGMVLLVPSLGRKLEGGVSRLTSVGGKFLPSTGAGLKRGVLTGLILGLVWSPCAGPILGTVATLAATQMLDAVAVFITLTFILGLGVPLFLFALLGRRILTKTKILSPYTGRIQQFLGLILILAALALYTGFDVVVLPQALNYCPPDGSYINPFENSRVIEKGLFELKNPSH